MWMCSFSASLKISIGLHSHFSLLWGQMTRCWHDEVKWGGWHGWDVMSGHLTFWWKDRRKVVYFWSVWLWVTETGESETTWKGATVSRIVLMGKQSSPRERVQRSLWQAPACALGKRQGSRWGWGRLAGEEGREVSRGGGRQGTLRPFQGLWLQLWVKLWATGEFWAEKWPDLIHT